MPPRTLTEELEELDHAWCELKAHVIAALLPLLERVAQLVRRR